MLDWVTMSFYAFSTKHSWSFVLFGLAVCVIDSGDAGDTLMRATASSECTKRMSENSWWGPVLLNTGCLVGEMQEMNSWLVGVVALLCQRASVFDKHFYLPQVGPIPPRWKPCPACTESNIGMFAAVGGPWKAGRCIYNSDNGEEAWKKPTEKYKMTYRGVEGRAPTLVPGKWKEPNQSRGTVGLSTH